MTVSPREIAVVIQGGVDAPLLERCVDSVRAHLPGCEIVLSTWEGTAVHAPERFDRIVLSPDPGARPNSADGTLNNTNRQLVSTLAGLRSVSRPHALKLRTDAMLEGKGFLDAFGLFPQRDPALVLLERKVVIPRYATRLATTKRPYLFHPSDIAFFGLTGDLLRLFDIPLVTEEEFAWHLHSPDPAVRQHMAQRKLYMRLTPEQHIFVKALQRQGFAVDMPYLFADTPALAEQSQRLLINNFIVVPEAHFGLVHQKDKLRRQIETDTDPCYSLAQYAFLYREYFDPAHPLSARSQFVGRSALDYRKVEGLLKHTRRCTVFVERSVEHARAAFGDPAAARRAQASKAFHYFHRSLAEAVVAAFWAAVVLIRLPAYLWPRRRPQRPAPGASQP